MTLVVRIIAKQRKQNSDFDTEEMGYYIEISSS